TRSSCSSLLLRTKARVEDEFDPLAEAEVVEHTLPRVERDDLADERFELHPAILHEREGPAPGARGRGEAGGDDELLLEDGVERDRDRLAEDADLHVAAATPGAEEAGGRPAGAPRALDRDVEALLGLELFGVPGLEAEALGHGQPDLVAPEPGDEHTPAERPRDLGGEQPDRARARDEHLVARKDRGRVAEAMAHA